MNKADLTEILAHRGDLPKTRAVQVIDIVTGAIGEALVAGEKVTLSGFGSFKVSKRRGFQGHNPKDGSPVTVPPRTIPVFKAGKALKAALNPE